ncbi:hypothetical protein CIT292_09119 [Citrobacter youngae ATCC 29220]|uniref:Uncharacterized protein n=1 Tax=Citrobacter youngae ATCC 29220 TaxID=500640 RepID=D4BFU9_9ENTR|nr:hypothetical protein CIT292_09119 [Citrobacter youngae ATCC 29220]
MFHFCNRDRFPDKKATQREAFYTNHPRWYFKKNKTTILRGNIFE